MCWDDRYESRIEELRAKFHNSARMRAEYDLYCKKKVALVQTIRNALFENELMLEIFASSPNQNFIFSGQKRKSLILQQNVGLRNTIKTDCQSDLDLNDIPSFRHSMGLQSMQFDSGSTRSILQQKKVQRLPTNLTSPMAYTSKNST